MQDTLSFSSFQTLKRKKLLNIIAIFSGWLQWYFIDKVYNNDFTMKIWTLSSKPRIISATIISPGFEKNHYKRRNVPNKITNHKPPPFFHKSYLTYKKNSPSIRILKSLIKIHDRAPSQSKQADWNEKKIFSLSPLPFIPHSAVIGCPCPRVQKNPVFPETRPPSGIQNKDMARLLCKYLESRMETWRLETPGREREREKGNHAKIRRQQILDTRVLFDRSVENNGDGDVITRLRGLVALTNNVVEQRPIGPPLTEIVIKTTTWFCNLFFL